MKFSQIKVGERFVWNGEPYVKGTALIANHAETGANKMVPRYANVKVAEIREDTARSLSTADDMLVYVVSELTRAIDSSTLSDEARSLVLNEIEIVKQDAEKKIA